MEWFLYKQLFLPLSFFPPDQTRSKVKRHQAHLKKMCGQNSPPFLFYVKTLQMSNTPFYIQQRRLLPSALHPSFFAVIESVQKEHCCIALCLQIWNSAKIALIWLCCDCYYSCVWKGVRTFFVFSCGKISATTPKKHPPSKRTANGLLTIKPCCFSYNSIECLADSN